MFEKREVRVVPGARREDLWTRSWDWWARQGFHLTQTSSYRMHGSSFYSRIGLRREFDLAIDDTPAGPAVDLKLNAQLTDEGLVAGAVSAIVFFPVAVVGGALSYSEYETDARNLMVAFWQYIYAASAAGTSAASPIPAVPPPCTGCGAALLPDWKVCPYCGRPRS